MTDLVKENGFEVSLIGERRPSGFQAHGPLSLPVTLTPVMVAFAPVLYVLCTAQ